MATTTIHSLKYQIIADTSKFDQTIVATKKELQDQKRVLREIETPAEKYGKQIQRLDELYHKGLISSEQYRKKINQIEKEFKEAGKAATQASKATTDWVGAAKAGFTALAGSYVVTQFVDQIKGAVTEMDHLAKLAHRSGIDMEEFQRIALAMGYATEASVEDVANMLNKMQRAIGEAVTGNKELGETFDRLNMSAGELSTMAVDQQFLAIVDAISKIPTEAEQAAAATELFGRGSAVALDQIRNGIDSLAESIDRVDKLDVLIANDDLAKMEEIADEMTDISLAWKDIWNNAAIIASPLITATRDATVALRDLTEGRLPGSRQREADANEARTTLLNEGSIDRYLRFRKEITGLGLDVPLTSHEMNRLLPNGAGSIGTTDPNQLNATVNRMVDELSRIEGNLRELLGTVENQPRTQR